MSGEFTSRHGTPAGWRAHQKRGERPCTPCYTAKNEYDARRKAQPKERLRSRQAAAAQHMALRALRFAHPDEYAELYRLAKLELAAADPVEKDDDA